MKVLFILHFPPPVHGSSIVGENIKRSKAVNAAFDCRYINLGTSLTIDEIGKSGFFKIKRYLSILANLISQLVRFKPDICYVAITAKGLAFFKDALVVLIAKLFRVKIVYHIHNKGVSLKEGQLLYRIAYRFVFKNAFVILLSKYLYPDVARFVDERNVFYCPNGVPQGEERSYKNASADQNEVRLLFLSNLIESKGIYYLLDACELLVRNGINFKCHIVGGEGDVTSDLFFKRVGELNLTQYVQYHGKLFGDQKESILLNTDIFILPTYNDCFPLVLLEAMQKSLPIISTAEGGIPEIVSDGVTGFVIPPKNSEILFEKIALLANNPALRTSMGEAGRKRYFDNFTLNHFESNFVEIMSSIGLR